MIRKFFREKRVVKYVCLTAGLAVVCTAVLFALSITNAFGKFEAKEPYVIGDAVRVNVTVTPEGVKTDQNRKEENQKGANGSGAKPCSPKVPTCEGLKGSKTNPFVLLEIVPDLSHQQMIYLSQDEGSTGPLDLMKIGIDIAQKEKKTYAPSSAMMNQDLLKSMGQWFSNNTYSVYKIGGGDEKENLPFAYIDKLYSIKVTDAQINEMTGDDTAAERFDEIFKETKQEHATDWHDIKKLSQQFPNVFKKDSDGKKIRDITLDDRYNWKASKDTVTLTEEDAETYTGSGYLVMVEPGEGEFGFASKQARQKWEFTKTGTDADRWVYVETEEEMKEKYPDYLQNYDKTGGIFNDGFYYTKEDWTKTGYLGLDLLYEDQGNQDFTGLVYKLNNESKCKYVKTPKESKVVYSFDYYGVTNHNIMKRALFTFKDKKDYENFHMQVICMTPAQLNKLCKSDTDTTVDMIERADMYVIQSGDLDGSVVNDTKMLKDLYYNYVEPDKERSKEDITFYENDLEWSLCQKIIQRVSSVKTLPLVFNQMVGRLLELGISRNPSEKETHMYVTKGVGTAAESRLMDIQAKGSRNNLSKLYLISIQFNLLARKETESGYERTFMEDIYPDIKTISIPPEKGVVDGTATTTGYYKGSIGNERKLCPCPISGKITQEFKERVYYLWNTYTFLPVDIEANLNGNLSEETKDKLITQGYKDNYFKTNDGNAFSGSSAPSHQSGSNGYDNKNVTVISDKSNSNTNHSSILGNNGDAGGLASVMMDVMFGIMANDNQQVNPVTVTAEEQRKMYVKMADDTVMIDYEDDGKLEKEKQLYLKVRIWNNENNRPGQVKSIFLVKNKENKKEMKLYQDKTFTKECEFWKNKNNEYVKGTYNVPSNAPYLEGYVKFYLSDWKKGYKTMRFDTVGYNYDSKKKREESTDNRCDISIIGKTLFELQ